MSDSLSRQLVIESFVDEQTNKQTTSEDDQQPRQEVLQHGMTNGGIGMRVGGGGENDHQELARSLKHHSKSSSTLLQAID